MTLDDLVVLGEDVVRELRFAREVRRRLDTYKRLYPESLESYSATLDRILKVYDAELKRRTKKTKKKR